MKHLNPHHRALAPCRSTQFRLPWRHEGPSAAGAILTSGPNITSRPRLRQQVKVPSFQRYTVRSMSTITILCAAGPSLVLPRDSASEIRVTMQQHAEPLPSVEVQAQSLDLGATLSRVQIGNQQKTATSYVQGHTNDKQLAASPYLTADVLVDQYFARLYTRTTCMARHGSIQKDFKRARGLDCLHTGPASGLRGCSLQSLTLPTLQYLSPS